MRWHRTAGFPLVAAFQQGLSGGFGFSAGEPLAALLIGLLAFVGLRKPRLGLRWLAVGAGALVLSFYLSWGLAYQYPPLSERLASIPAGRAPASTARLIHLAEQAARLVGRAAEASPDFSGDDAAFLSRIDRGVKAGISGVSPHLEAAPVSHVAFGPTRLSRVSFAMSRLRISGYYFPWTGEALINAEMPRTQWSRTVAHEKAHQRGHARENEATVIGVLNCLASPDPTVFYGGAMGLFAALDREVARFDREARRRIWTLLPARAARDFEIESAFWRAREGVAAEVSERVNDTYLKVQGVQSGVASYGETTRLILQAIETPSLELGRLLR